MPQITQRPAETFNAIEYFDDIQNLQLDLCGLRLTILSNNWFAELVDIVNQMEFALKDTLALALDIDRFMRRIHANLHPKAQAIDEEKVGPLGGMVLMTIAENEPVSIQKLTRHLARDKAQMTRLIQMLERKALLHRAQSSDDGRVSLISLTARGHTLVAGFQAGLAEVVEDLLEGVGAAERHQFSATLRKVLSNKAETAGT